MKDRLRKRERSIANPFDASADLNLARPGKLSTKINHQACNDEHRSFREYRWLKEKAYAPGLKESREHCVIDVSLAVGIPVPDKIEGTDWKIFEDWRRSHFEC
jgi:hypothetical protein